MNSKYNFSNKRQFRHVIKTSVGCYYKIKMSNLKKNNDADPIYNKTTICKINIIQYSKELCFWTSLGRL